MDHFDGIEFLTPKTLEEALKLKEQHKSNIVLMSGGTDVLVSIRGGHPRFKKPNILNIGLLEELKFIKEENDYIAIGSANTHSELIESSLIQNFMPHLADAVSRIGSTQIRNQGTICGNLVMASPAGDSIGPLVTREAKIVAKSSKNVRIIPIKEFLIGPGQTSLKEDEIVVEIRVPKTPINWFKKYISLRQRKALSCNKVSVSLELNLDDENSVIEARIALGAVAPTVVRAKKTEAFLKGKILEKENLELFKKAEELANSECSPIDDTRSNKNYRKIMTGILVSKALRMACGIQDTELLI